MTKVIGTRTMVVDCITPSCRSKVAFDWSEVERKEVYGERGKYIKCPKCGQDIQIEAEWNGKTYWKYETVNM